MQGTIRIPLNKAVNVGDAAITALLDQSSAFDPVDHQILLDRLAARFGLSGFVLSWFQSYLCDRTQSISVNQVSSSSTPLLCGVPQGSVLGPVLYILYISSMHEIASAAGKADDYYADDAQYLVTLSISSSTQKLSVMEKYGIDGDEAVRATNDDASFCKKFAVQLGYWKDPFISQLVRNTDRKAPEINRGYFTRVIGITTLVHRFIRAVKGNCQIVSFGAGFDTLFWRLSEAGFLMKKYVEIDFPNVTSRKSHYIRNSSQMTEFLEQLIMIMFIIVSGGETRFSGNEIHSNVYHLVAADVRNLAEVETKLIECSIEMTVPTLFLFECVLVYIPVKSSHALLKFLADKFSSTFCINYEQVNMMDRFGEVMLTNLRSRGCALAGVEACSSLKSQEDRFIINGWDGAEALDMNQVYHQVISPSEIMRIEKIEFLDEKELLDQLFHHYCICVAWKSSLDFKFNLLTIN
nr:EOG090X08O3 [Macrothrix elegans]